MLAVPFVLQAKYEKHLRDKAIPNNLQVMYQKWLRYYLYFFQKYYSRLLSIYLRLSAKICG
jgi:hypothetical protein